MGLVLGLVHTWGSNCFSMHGTLAFSLSRFLLAVNKCLKFSAFQVAIVLQIKDQL